MAEIPEDLLRRSAQARAAATGESVEAVLAEMRAAVDGTAIEPPPETAPADAEPEHATSLSDDLLEREAAARASALGVSREDAMAEMRGEEKLEVPAAQPVADTPDSDTAEPAEPEPELDAEPAAPPAGGTAVPLFDAAGMIDYGPASEALGMSATLLKRSVEAKAGAKGLEPIAVLAEMTGQPVPETPAVEPAPEPAVTEPAPVAAEASAPAAASGPLDYAAASEQLGMPEALLKRSVEAKAKSKGLDPAAVLAEMTGQPVPTAASAPSEPVAAPAAPAASSAPAGEPDWAAAASAAGMPEKLFRRSVEAKAKAKGVDPAVVLAEMTGQPAPAAPAASSAPAAATAPAAPAAAAPAPAATATFPKDVRPQRLLTVVKARAIQQVKAEPTDKVSTWPHLLLIEFVALLAITALLIVMSVVIQAPLLEAANANVTPNPSKAPWYFLGLQELLTYFDPQIAGVTVPTIIGVIGFMAIPYIDRNPSNKPADRKFAIFMYTFFIMGSAALTIIGTLFRGKGFNFSYPWSDGIFFDDLKDWINFE